jgi:uncharacterized RDD family membrane protein YckC
MHATAPAQAPAQVTAVRTDIFFAGFWRRLLAYVIDSVLLAGVYLSIFTAVQLLSPGTLDNGPIVRGGRVDVYDLAATLRGTANIMWVCGWIGWAYYVIFESSPLRGTLGKFALGLYVADTHGDPISFVRAVFRNFFKTFSTLVLGVGWLMAAFTPRKQALHDLLAGTLVLRKSHRFVIGREAPSDPGEHWDGTRWVASVPPLERS